MTAIRVVDSSGSIGVLQLADGSGGFDGDSRLRFLTGSSDLVLSCSLVVTGGMSGSLTKLPDGTSYLVAGSNVTLTTGSSGAITIASSADTQSTFFSSPASGFLNTTGSLALAGSHGTSYKASDAGSDVFMFVSGSLDSKKLVKRGVALFGGDVVVSGTLYAEKQVIEVDEYATGSLLVSGSLVVSRSADIGGTLTANAGSFTTGMSGSLTRLTDGRSYISAGANVTVSSASNGQVIIASAAGFSRSKKTQVITIAEESNVSFTMSGSDMSVAGFDPSYIDLFLNGQLLSSGTVSQILISAVDYTVESSNSFKFSFDLQPDDAVTLAVFTKP